MKNINTDYQVMGSSALKSNEVGTIIAFPSPQDTSGLPQDNSESSELIDRLRIVEADGSAAFRGISCYFESRIPSSTVEFVEEFSSREYIEELDYLELNKLRNPLRRTITILSAFGRKITTSLFVQELVNGTIQGKPFDDSKTWQTVVVGCCLFVIAIVSIYIGR